MTVLAWTMALGTFACTEEADTSPRPELASVSPPSDMTDGHSENSGVVSIPDSISAALPATVPEDAPVGMTAREASRDYAQMQRLVFFIITPEDQATCPAEILLTDPSGRRVGVDPKTMGLLEEIPGAWYDEAGVSLAARSPCGMDEDVEATPRLVIEDPAPGGYHVTLVGKAPGAYDLVVDLYPADWRQQSRRVHLGGGMIDAGKTETYVLRI